jgi:O-antigen/teichoic acid export membrane protein
MYLKSFFPSMRISHALATREHVLWVIFQQVILRGLVGLKFLLVGRMLGPEAVGLIGVALLALAVTESLSDTGLPQAIVQQPAATNADQIGAIWTLLLLRGFVVGLVLFLGAGPIAGMLNVPSAAPLIALAAIIPLLRNGLHPGLYMVQRDRNFKALAILEMSATGIDLCISILLVFYDFGPIAVVIGSITAELIRVSGSWIFFSVRFRPNFDWGKIRKFVSYGRWIWSSSVLSLLLNQLDKLVVASLLGATEFGFYQMAYKLAQLSVADAAFAFSQYLFPTFAEKYRRSPEKTRLYFVRTLIFVGAGAVVLALCVGLIAPVLIPLLLGPRWITIVPILRALLVTLSLSAIISIIVVYARAIGRPELVTQATALQLMLLLVLAPIAALHYGTIGMAWAMAACIAVAALWILQACNKLRDTSADGRR